MYIIISIIATAVVCWLIFAAVYYVSLSTSIKNLIRCLNKALPDRYWRSELQSIITNWEDYEEQFPDGPALKLSIPTIMYYCTELTLALDNFAKSRDLILIYDKVDIFQDHVTLSISRINDI